MLTEHGCKIAPSTYYEYRRRRVTRRQIRDRHLVDVMVAERAEDPMITRFGARKMWLHLRGEGIDVARCTVERLFRGQGRQGSVRRRKFKPAPSDGTPRPDDHVERQFWSAHPNRLWVTDFTYVPTWSGMVYVAFIIDVFSRRIVGWRAASRMTTPLVLDALEHALWARGLTGPGQGRDLVHHTDAGSQYVSIAMSERLAEAGITASAGSNHDPYDNASAESTIGLYKTELIRPEGPWRGVDDVEAATLRWVDFYNHRRPHEALDDLTPQAAEDLYHDHHHQLQPTG